MSKVRCPICDTPMPGNWQDYPDYPFCTRRCRTIDNGDVRVQLRIETFDAREIELDELLRRDLACTDERRLLERAREGELVAHR